MNRDAAISIIKRHEAELKQLGVVSVSLFGSTARDEATEESDIDLALTLAPGEERGLAYLAKLDALKEHLKQILGASVDIVAEPTMRPRIQDEINRDRRLAF